MAVGLGLTKLIVWTLSALIGLVTANHDAKRLYDDLLENGYNKLIRPVENNSQKLNVKMGLKLSQVIDVVSDNECISAIIGWF